MQGRVETCEPPNCNLPVSFSALKSPGVDSTTICRGWYAFRCPLNHLTIVRDPPWEQLPRYLGTTSRKGFPGSLTWKSTNLAGAVVLAFFALITVFAGSMIA